MSFQSWCPVFVRHFVVKSIKKRLLAGIGPFGFLLLAASLCVAQNGSSSSGSSGHSSAPPAPSFSASAPASHAPANSGASYSARTPGMPGHNPENPHQPTQPHRTWGNNGAGSTGEVYYPYPYAVLVPYPVADANASDDTPTDSDDDAEYQGGPTVFDRRGSGAASYVPPVESVADQSQTDESQSEGTTESSPEPPGEPTVLVFKDGHEIEIQNYAVVSQTLYDLTPGHRRKIDLAELDLPATEKMNDDRGIVFELPASSQAN